MSDDLQGMVSECNATEANGSHITCLDAWLHEHLLIRSFSMVARWLQRAGGS